MGQVVDFVPNHMGIGEPLNQWWMDVLRENGPSSHYAPYFSISNGSRSRPICRTRLVLLPILGDQYGRVLRAGRIAGKRFEAGAFFLRYYEHEFLDGRSRHLPATSSRSRSKNWRRFRNEEFYARNFKASSRPSSICRAGPRPILNASRNAHAPKRKIIKRRLERRCQTPPQVCGHGCRSRRANQRRAWRSAEFQICARRAPERSIVPSRVFGEWPRRKSTTGASSTSMIWLRSGWKCPEVFDATHRLLLELVGAGVVTGVRIDHPDVASTCPNSISKNWQRCCAWKRSAFQFRPTVARSISWSKKFYCQARRRCGEDWPVHGTTGYEFGVSWSRAFWWTSRRSRRSRAGVSAFHRPLDALRPSGLREETPGHAALAG